jgi:hypothetical protein
MWLAAGAPVRWERSGERRKSKEKEGDMLYSSCQGRNEHLRSINNYNMIDNTHFPEHTYP